MLRKLMIKNYKSVYNNTIDLGRTNVFIGENGCGKTNILEAVAMAGASKSLDLNAEGLYNRGVRVAKPNLTFSSFTRLKQNSRITLDLEFQIQDEKFVIPSLLYCEDKNDIYAKWKDDIPIYQIDETEIHIPQKSNIIARELLKSAWLPGQLYNLTQYLIFDLDVKSLRGIKTESKKMPLGINSRNLFSEAKDKSDPLVHPSDQLASALIGSAAMIKLKAGDAEIQVDPKKLRKSKLVESASNKKI